MSLIDQLSSALVTLSLLLTSITGGITPQSQVAQVGGSITPSFVQGAVVDSYPGANTQSVNFSNPVSDGNLIAGYVFWTSSASLNSITGCGNTYTLVNNPTTGSFKAAGFYTINSTNGSCTLTANFSADPGGARIVTHEVNGISTSNPLDVSALRYQSNGGVSVNGVSSGSVTTTTDGDYIFGVTSSDSNPTVSVGTGFTSRLSGTGGIRSEDTVQSTAGSISATFTSGSNFKEFYTLIMAFRPAQSSTTPPPATPAPTITSFSASPTSITSGQSTTLSWSTTNATSLSISGIGTVTGISVSVSPTQTTTYTLTATNSSGSVTANTTVTVSAPVQTDTTAPTTPTGLSTSVISSSQVNLTWSPSTDAVGVTGYRIYRGGVQIGTSVGTSYSDTGLNPSTTYSYTVSAYDAAGNNSTQSSSVSGTTQDIVTTGSLIPSDRLAPWQGNVGVEGGIPNRTTICSTLNPGATVAQINSAISACPSGQVVYLNAGTYNLSGTINMLSNKTLRGAGPDQTILLFSSSSGQDVSFNGGYTDTTTGGINITSGYTKDSNQLTLSSASGISTGSFVYISELNDPSIPVDPNGAEGPCQNFGACGMYPANGSRLRFQLSKVTAVSGNTITISPAMLFTFSSTRSPQVHKLTSNPVQYSGLESLTVKNTSTNNSKNIRMQGVANSWVKNVKTDTCGKRCIEAWLDVYRNEIRDNYLTKCIDRTNSDTCYGVHIWSGTGNLIENNIFDNTANGVVIVSSSGNVVSYNYMYGVHRSDTSWFWPDAWTHGAHNSYNLWEGNDQTALEWDLYWGSNSHNTSFRNRFHGKDDTINYPAGVLTVGSILTYPNNTYNNNIGNVLGTSGFSNKYEETVYSATSKPIYLTVSSIWGLSGAKSLSTMLRHMNYDYFTNSTKKCSDAGEPGCQGGSGSVTLPASLYLSSKPSWFGSAQWPPIGPDVSGLTTSIPAKNCFDNVIAKGSVFNASTCYSGGTTPPPSDTTPPSTPTGLSASVVSSSQINLTWSASTDAVGVTGYKIYRGGTQIGTSVGTSYSDSGLNPSTTYSYTVSAYDGAGNNSTQSTSASATTQAVLPVISNLVGSNITTSSITISWDTNVPTNGQVFYGLTTSYGSQSALLDNTTKTTTHSTTLSGLTPNTTYNFKVTSVDALGNTTSSANFSFTTGPATPTDVTAPTISGITKSSITTSGATISWTTNENSDTQVEYGLTTAYGSQTTLNTTLLTAHSATLSGLTASTTYNFRVKSKDAAGNLAVSSNQTVTTLPLPDTTAPTISNVVISSVTANSATVTWTTNENSDTQVDYGTTASYGSQTALNTTLSTTHSASITNLSSGVTYNIRVRSKDASGNLATSGNYTFTTTTPAPPTDTTAPVISSITTSNLTTSSIQVGWNTDESASGYVTYGTTASYGLTSPVDSTLKTSRTIGLSNLKRNTTYHYQVVSADASGNIGRSTDRTFTTPNRLPKPPKTSTLTATNGSVILTWSDPKDDNNDVYELWRGVLIMRSTAGFIQVPDKTTALADVPSATKTYRDTTVTAGTAYYYSVFTYDDQGTYSDPAYITFTPTEQTQASTGSGATSGGSPSTPGASSGSGAGDTASTPTVVVFIPKSSPLASTTPTVIQTPNLTIILITKTMSRGSKIAEVKTLQQFLISQGYLPANTPLGNYGPLTEQAVKAFQKKQGIVSSGSPATTGYGMVGARTRAVINALLQKQTPTATQTTSTTETPEQTLARLQALLKQLQQLQGQR